MRLKAFAVYGFKSFAEKTEISFEDGITAIIGPNGSGKSNISDAIRWVLGEQSVKYLRGSKMEDVIFSGSGKRRSLGMAEVTLVFDNSDHKIPLDFDEISVCRRVFRSGDSEYFINKKSCRLKDIVDLFADSGLGRGSMSIIGQNRIDEVLNSRPEDRRNLFEETAGIARFRLRKKEASRRLEDTGNNLTRINDIKAELEERLEPLRISSERTKAYNKYSDELRTCRLTQVVRKIENIENVEKSILDKIKALELKNTENIVDVNFKENDVIAIKVRLDKLNDEFNSLQAGIAERETKLEKMHGKEAVLQERIIQSEKSIKRLKEQKEKLSVQLTDFEYNLSGLSETYDAVDLEQKIAEKAANEMKDLQSQQQAQIVAAETRITEFKASAFESMQRIIDLRNEIRGLENEQELRQKKREQIKHKITEQQAQIEILKNRSSTLTNEKNSLVAANELLSANQVIFEEKLRESQKTINTYFAERNRLNSELSSLDTKVRLLENMQKEYEGFTRGVKKVLHTNTPWRSGVLGVVAELFTVKKEYVTAIETALGGAVQNIVTENVEIAKEAVKYLKQNREGRATFLPLDTLKPYPLRNEDKKYLRATGVLGLAADLIECEIHLKPIAKFLLGRIFITDTLDNASQLARSSGYKLKIVTLEGDVFNPGGSLTGGSSKQKESGLLARKNEINVAEERIKFLNKQVLILQENIEKIEADSRINKDKLEDTKNILQKNRVRLAELTAYLERLVAELEQKQEEVLWQESEKEQLGKDYLAMRSKLIEVRPKLQAMELQDADAKRVVDQLQEELTKTQRAAAATGLRYQNACITLESTKERAKLLGERIKQIDADTVRLQNEIRENEAEKNKMIEIIEESNSAIKDIERQKNNLLAELENETSGKEVFSARRLNLTQELAVAEEKLLASKKNLTAGQQKLHLIEIEKVKQETEYQTAVENIYNNFNVTFEEASKEELLFNESDLSLRKTENELNKQINDLGAINPGAIEEYKVVSERYEFLNIQYQDLFEAKERLEEVIGGINANMSKKFKEALIAINEHFIICYKKLFGGGSARLELQNPNDFLESGIEIIVQPPGKKLQSLFLLSGGERALTVIALLFALLSYKPAPFCILDEIDAPLDEANIERFAGFLKEFAKDTQFIVITHRKGVMEAADVLHGITMEESGVSKLLSVKLEEKH
ncbi:MAG TPA: chromosome segregation protein SMC [Candidatus Avacidaminococcus intestinavium]|uniref:Chromosome partition protein Smc n=1 Tax=Candidatus Avacidaminococcus intestinavium TaxID=2840684 RepID=A0A9D1SKG2_9FIRM|nr:chromosome segregation protein SMC [Candidatus Avacidaminococcus intestinavium]